MNESSNPAEKSKSAIEAETALSHAQQMPPGPARLKALKQAGKLRNEACLRDIEALERRSK